MPESDAIGNAGPMEKAFFESVYRLVFIIGKHQIFYVVGIYRYTWQGTFTLKKYWTFFIGVTTNNDHTNENISFVLFF